MRTKLKKLKKSLLKRTRKFDRYREGLQIKMEIKFETEIRIKNKIRL